MCGIAGYIGKRRINNSNIKSTLQIMKNRGPDYQDYKNIFNDDINITLLHSRLSIIDLNERSNQPFVFKNNVLIFNGEIYNYIELREHLKNKNYNFKTNSDTEVLIKLFDCYSEKAFSFLEGMWALAIYNTQSQELILSRDRFGEKPLNIHKTSHGIYFGSEAKFIEELCDLKFQANDLKTKHFLNYGYNSTFLNNQTFKKEIKSINESSYLIVDNNLNIKNNKYWKIKNNEIKKEIKNKELEENIKELLTNALKIRMRSDVKNIFCLSGGIDSGSLVSLATKKLNNNIETFSIIDAKSNKYDESNLIKHTIKDTGVKPYFLYTENINFFDSLRKIVKYYNSPIFTINYLLHALMQEEISKKGFKVVISGNGADEFFAGYYDHYLYHLADLRNNADNINYKINFNYWKKHLLPNLRNKNYKNFYKYYNNQNKNLSFNKEFTEYVNNNKSINFIIKKIFNSSLKNNMLAQIPERLSPILYMDDMNSMRSSLENRTPFLDRNLIEYAFSIPSKFYIQKGYNKYLLRKSMNGILNNKIRTARKKYGFNASLTSFNDFNKKNYIENLFDNIINIKHLINEKKLYKFVNNLDFMNMTDNESKFLFRLISTSFFYNNNN